MEQTMVEFFGLLFMALALGMDAFSIGLGMGSYKLRLKQVLIIGFTVGIFHVWMPLLGIFSGKLLSAQFGLFASYAGAGLLLFLWLANATSPEFRVKVKRLWLQLEQD